MIFFVLLSKADVKIRNKEVSSALTVLTTNSYSGLADLLRVSRKDVFKERNSAND